MPIIISQKYFINVDYRGTTKYYKRKKNEVRYEKMLVDELIDYFTIDLIDMKTGEVEKSIDMKKLLVEYLNENIYGWYNDQGVEINGQYYIKLWLYKKPRQEDVWQDEQEIINLLFNIETETFEVIEDSQQVNELLRSHYWKINEEFLQLNGFDDDFGYINVEELYSQGELEIRMANNMIFQNNLKLYELFPELKTYAKESQCEYAIIRMPANEETTALDVLEYFVDPKVGLRFDGFTLTGEESIDGQSHYIESREQFEQYYNGYWENSNISD